MCQVIYKIFHYWCDATCKVTMPVSCPQSAAQGEIWSSSYNFKLTTDVLIHHFWVGEKCKYYWENLNAGVKLMHLGRIDWIHLYKYIKTKAKEANNSIPNPYERIVALAAKLLNQLINVTPFKNVEAKMVLQIFSDPASSIWKCPKRGFN